VIVEAARGAHGGSAGKRLSNENTPPMPRRRFCGSRASVRRPSAAPSMASTSSSDRRSAAAVSAACWRLADPACWAQTGVAGSAARVTEATSNSRTTTAEISIAIKVQ